jgi:hypothetical protein
MPGMRAARSVRAGSTSDRAVAISCDVCDLEAMRTRSVQDAKAELASFREMRGAGTASE